MIPTYRTRARDTVEIGDIVTTEVPGLAEALRRPEVEIEAELHLTDGAILSSTVVLPDAIGTIAMKTLVRVVRSDARDVEDLWRCLEITAADGVEPGDFDDSSLQRVRTELWHQLGPRGAGLPALTESMQADAAAKLRTRIRALLAEVVGAD